METVENIQTELKKNLSEKRYLHSVGTMKMAKILANKYNVNENIAMLAGLAHDMAKEIPLEQAMEYIKENKINIDEIEKQNTALLHAKIGAHMSKKYGFTEQMQNAIKYHTTGNPEMDELAKIIYVADKTEETRNYEEIEKIRELAMQNIDEAIIAILDHDIQKNINKKVLIHPDGVLLRNKLLLQLINNNIIF